MRRDEAYHRQADNDDACCATLFKWIYCRRYRYRNVRTVPYFSRETVARGKLSDTRASMFFVFSRADNRNRANRASFINERARHLLVRFAFCLAARETKLLRRGARIPFWEKGPFALGSMQRIS